MTDPIKILRKITSPFRRASKAEDELEEYKHRKKLIIVLPEGYLTGEKYIKKIAMDLSKAITMYGDDVIIAYNNYQRAMKAKNNGNIPNGGAVSDQQALGHNGIQQKVQRGGFHPVKQ